MKSMRVFVMLPRALDAMLWHERFDQGAVPDKTPYGYHFAEEMGAKITFSQPTATPGGILGFVDKAVKRLLGFDIRHAWNNRESLLGTRFDVVWTHTEYEHLAIAALRAIFRGTAAPVIAQSVWLIDEWDRFLSVKRQFYRFLLRHVAVATFHSPENRTIADSRRIVSPTELVLFGISLDSFPLRIPRLKFDSPRLIRVLALGGDRHRDWKTLFDALGGEPGIELRVGSSSWPHSLKADNIQASLMSHEQVRAAYDWADCLVVSLKDNLHASGITAILEAVASGIPVVATLTGGLQAYFDNDAIAYVAGANPVLLLEAIQAMAKNPSAALDRAVVAQEQLVTRELTTRGFALRHVRLSERLIKQSDRVFAA